MQIGCVPGHFGAVQLKCFGSNAGLPYISKFTPHLFRQKSRKKRLAAWQAVKVQIDDLLPCRNQLAHNSPHYHGGGHRIYMGKGGVAARAERTAEPCRSITVDKRKLLLRTKDKQGRPNKKKALDEPMLSVSTIKMWISSKAS